MLLKFLHTTSGNEKWVVAKRSSLMVISLLRGEWKDRPSAERWRGGSHDLSSRHKKGVGEVPRKPGWRAAVREDKPLRLTHGCEWFFSPGAGQCEARFFTTQWFDQHACANSTGATLHSPLRSPSLHSLLLHSPIEFCTSMTYPLSLRSGIRGGRVNFIGECVRDFQLISVMSGTVDVLTFLGEWISCWREGGELH